MSERIDFRVHGKPAPKGSRKPLPYRGRDPRRRFVCPADNAPHLACWTNTVARTALTVRRRPLWSDAVHLDLTFYLPRGRRARRLPADLLVRHLAKPDLDKLERAVWDALAGLIYVDDAAVCSSASRKFYATDKEPPGVRIRAERIEQKPTDVVEGEARWSAESRP